jgi:hypothetical protein
MMPDVPLSKTSKNHAIRKCNGSFAYLLVDKGISVIFQKLF